MTALRAPRGKLALRLAVVAAVIAGVAVLIGANAHLVYVAFTSQPDCVTHLKSATESGDGFRAARSSC